jgi:Ni/Co efflux regulator RcnB
MNRFVAAVVAASALVAPSLALAQERPPERSGEVRTEERREAPHRADAGRSHAAPSAYHAAVRQPHAWRAGARFDRHAASGAARVVHLDHYGLTPPPRGHVWVRAGDDALLVRLASSTVIAIRPGAFA